MKAATNSASYPFALQVLLKLIQLMDLLTITAVYLVCCFIVILLSCISLKRIRLSFVSKCGLERGLRRSYALLLANFRQLEILHIIRSHYHKRIHFQPPRLEFFISTNLFERYLEKTYFKNVTKVLKSKASQIVQRKFL